MSNSDCGCGGCGTGTTCLYTNTPLKDDAQYSVTAYATPDILGQPTGVPWIQAEPHYVYSADPHTILQEELFRDLLDRVRKLEKKLSRLQKEVRRDERRPQGK